MRKPYDPIADEEPHIVAEYHFQNCTAYSADNYLRRLACEDCWFGHCPDIIDGQWHFVSLLFPGFCSSESTDTPK